MTSLQVSMWNTVMLRQNFTYAVVSICYLFHVFSIKTEQAIVLSRKKRKVFVNGLTITATDHGIVGLKRSSKAAKMQN